MELRKELENYNIYLVQIKSKEYEIKKLENDEVVLNGSNFKINGDIRPKGFMSSNNENKAINNADKIAKLKKEIEELKTKVEIIDTLLNTLKYRNQQLIRMYFFEKKDVRIIASILNRSDNSSIHNSISRIIKTMEKTLEVSKE